MESRMNKRQEQKEKTRKLLLYTAMEVFSENGLLSARTSDIAIRANVSHGAIFVHFPTREDLLVAVVNEFGEKITARLHELLQEQNGLDTMLFAYLQVIAEYEAFYIKLVSEITLLPIIVRHEIVMIQSAISHHICQQAEKLMKQGEIKEMPLHLLFNTWLGLVHYYLMNKDLFAPQDSVVTKYGDVLVKHFMMLILK